MLAGEECQCVSQNEPCLPAAAGFDAVFTDDLPDVQEPATCLPTAVQPARGGERHFQYKP